MKFIEHTEFSKNVLKLLSGTFFAQLLSILIAPVLTRIYSPEDFGFFTLISSIFGIIALISGGRYEIAILLPKKESHAANLLVLSLLINTFFLFVFYGVLICISPLLSNSYSKIWIFTIPFFVFFVGYAQAILAWFNRKKKYNQIVVNKVINSTVTNFSGIFIGLSKFKLNGLLLAILLSNFISFIVLFFQLKSDIKFIRSSFDKRLILCLARRYIKFPVFNTFQALLDAFQMNGLIYFISYFFGSYSLGFFSLSIRILMMPMNLIGGSLSQVFFQEASLLFNEEKDLRPLMRKMLLRSIYLAIPILLFIMLFAPFIFNLVFGKLWIESGIFAQIIAPWILIDFVRAPLSQIPLIYNKQQKMLIFSIISNSVIVVFLFCGIFYKFDLKSILILLTILECIYLTILIKWFFDIVKKHQISNHKEN